MAGGRKDQCGECHANVTKSQGSILCKICNLWYHAPCSSLSEGDIAALKEYKGLSFVCASCQRSSRTVDERSLRDEITTLNKKFDDFLSKGDEERNSIKQAFADVVADLKLEVSSCIKDMKSDIVDCSKLIRHVESSTLVKTTQLEIENNILHRKLNRGDLIVSGLPDGLPNLTAPIIELGAFYKVQVSLSDINHVCYINSKKSVLVKFNSVMIRDEIIRLYFKSIKTRPLVVTDLVKLDGTASSVHNEPNNATVEDNINARRIDKRIFLNDHFSPAAGKMHAMCKQLLKNKIVLKFKVLDADMPRSKLTMLDGKEIVMGLTECAALLKENPAATTVL